MFDRLYKVNVYEITGSEIGEIANKFGPAIVRKGVLGPIVDAESGFEYNELEEDENGNLKMSRDRLSTCGRDLGVFKRDLTKSPTAKDIEDYNYCFPITPISEIQNAITTDLKEHHGPKR